MANRPIRTNFIQDSVDKLRPARGSTRRWGCCLVAGACCVSLMMQLGIFCTLLRAQEIIGPSTKPSGSGDKAGTAIGIYVIPVSNVHADQIAGLITAIYKSNDTSSPGNTDPANAGLGYVQSALVEPSTNALVLVGDAAAADHVRKLVKELDSLRGETREVLKAFPLIVQNAANSARILNTLFGPGLPTTRPATDGLPRESAPVSRFSAIADRKLNMLFVVASPDVMQRVQEIVSKLEPNDETQNVPATFIYRLGHTHAKKTAALLMSLFHYDGFPPKTDPDFEFEEWYFNAVADEDSETVVITGSRRAVNLATTIIEQLDKPPHIWPAPAGVDSKKDADIAPRAFNLQRPTTQP